jgi:hypothetical protein
MRKLAKEHLATILKALDAPQVGKDISTSKWREILDEVAGAVASRLDCLNEEALAED